jgi:hypothetical protein
MNFENKEDSFGGRGLNFLVLLLLIFLTVERENE